MKDKILPILIALATILVVTNLIALDIGWLRQQKATTKAEVGYELIPTPIPSTTSDSCGATCQQTIDEKISQAVATISGKGTKAIEKTTSTTKTSQPQVIYIPLGGGGSTVSTDWTDVGNAEVYLNINDYPNLDKAYFEGFIKVKNGNGKVFARLYDVTHSIGVQGSDIESASENFTLVESGSLNFWQGKNLYRVQVKSLNGYEAYFDSGRIKIVLK